VQVDTNDASSGAQAGRSGVSSGGQAARSAVGSGAKTGRSGVKTEERIVVVMTQALSRQEGPFWGAAFPSRAQPPAALD
jgi:hypothetical protein